MCDDCLALKLSLSRNDVLATVRALEAEEPPALVVYPGVCSLCGRVQRVMQAWTDSLPTPKGDLQCPVCGRGLEREEGVAVADDGGLTHIHLECLGPFRARRRAPADDLG